MSEGDPAAAGAGGEGVLALVLDGERIDPARAAFLPLERGLLYGDGLFETMAVAGAIALGGGLHYARLAASAHELGLPAPAREAWERGLALALGAAAGATAVRVTWTRGAAGARGYAPDPVDGPPRLLVAAYRGRADDPPPGPRPVTLATVRGLAPGDLARHKTLSAMHLVVAAARAQALGADLALLVDAANRALEATGANLFVHDARRGLRTPPASLPILPGITRGQVLAWLPETREEDVSAADLLEADAAFVVNAVRGVVPVRAIDGRPLRAFEESPATARARSAYDAWRRRQLPAR